MVPPAGGLILTDGWGLRAPPSLRKVYNNARWSSYGLLQGSQEEESEEEVMALHDTDGNVQITAVDGNTYVGLYAPDQSVNVVVDDASHFGVYHPSGALRVSSTQGETYYDASGAVHLNRLFGTGAIAPLPLHSRLVFEGDSITAGSSGPTYAQFAITGSRGRYYCPVSYNQGTGGQTAAQMATQVANVTALNPKVVVFLAGTNDLSGTVDTPTTIYNNIRTCNAAYIAAGARVINICVLPRNDATWNALSASRKADRTTLNSLIKAQTDVTVVDLESTFDPTTHCVDGLHPNYAGAILIGNAVATKLNSNIVGTDPASLYLDASNFLVGATENPGLTGTTGVKSGTPAPTGEVATGWTVSHNDGMTVVCSKTTLNGRTAQRIVVSGTNSTNGRVVNLLNTVTYSGTVGQVYDTWWDFSLAAGCQNLRAISASSDTTAMPNATASVNLPGTAITGVMRPPNSAALAGSDTSTSVQFVLTFSAGTVAADITVAAPFFALASH